MNSLYKKYKISARRNTSRAFAWLLSLICLVVLLFTRVFKVAMRSKRSTPFLFCASDYMFCLCLQLLLCLTFGTHFET
jgi:hypothetical protein